MKPEPEPPELDRLLEAAVRGDGKAVGKLILAYDPLIKAEVRRRLKARLFASHGEDLLQTIRVALIKGLPKLRARNQTAFAAWIRTVVRNQVIDWAKARKAARQIPSRKIVRLDRTGFPGVAARTPTPSRIFFRHEDKELLLRAIECADPRYRPVLRFVYERSPTPRELVNFTGKETVDAMRKFMGRAREHLAEVMARLLRPGGAAPAPGDL